MKLLVIFMSLMLYTNAWTQINTKIKAKRVEENSLHKKRNKQQVGVLAFPILDGIPAATPISIPSPNREPLQLKPYNKMVYFSNPPESISVSGCSILRLIDNGMILRIYHKLVNYKPTIYAGAWLYDATGKALDVGYIPEAVSKVHMGFTDVKMSFGTLPIVSDYVEVILMKDGKTLLKKKFKMAFRWEKLQQYAELDLGKLNDVDLSKLIFQAPDLEITAIKSIDSNMNTVDFNKNCTDPDKLIFITNVGSKISANYQVKIGYYKQIDTKIGKYSLLKIVDKKALLPGKQTIVAVNLPQGIEHLKVEIVYEKGSAGEVNTANNILNIKCD